MCPRPFFFYLRFYYTQLGSAIRTSLPSPFPKHFLVYTARSQISPHFLFGLFLISSVFLTISSFIVPLRTSKQSQTILSRFPSYIRLLTVIPSSVLSNHTKHNSHPNILVSATFVFRFHFPILTAIIKQSGNRRATSNNIQKTYMSWIKQISHLSITNAYVRQWRI